MPPKSLYKIVEHFQPAMLLQDHSFAVEYDGSKNSDKFGSCQCMPEAASAHIVIYKEGLNGPMPGTRTEDVVVHEMAEYLVAYYMAALPDWVRACPGFDEACDRLADHIRRMVMLDE